MISYQWNIHRTIQSSLFPLEFITYLELHLSFSFLEDFGSISITVFVFASNKLLLIKFHSLMIEYHVENML